LRAVDPELLVYQHLLATGPHPGPITILALGKAAAAMCRGAARALGPITGICVTNAPSEVPAGVELLIGDHPVVGARSLEAGRRLLELARRSTGPCLVLVSGGGSALCEHPLDGIEPGFLTSVTTELVASGAPIDEVNLIRAHLSAIKGGGLATAVPGDIETLIISDVAGRSHHLVASGPTIPVLHEPEAVIDLLRSHGHELGADVKEAIRRPRPMARVSPSSVIGDGMVAARAMCGAAEADGCPSTIMTDWIWGPVEACLDRLMATEHRGLVVGAGEPVVPARGEGHGGRCTHSALLAASRIAGTPQVFAALATDGHDGTSGAAGAVVDGSTLGRGGDPREALDRCDSARYLRSTGDLVVSGDTGTNVADVWALLSP
jgi:hydroxypyruvate reductase